jgi:hypothetical protein
MRTRCASVGLSAGRRARLVRLPSGLADFFTQIIDNISQSTHFTLNVSYASIQILWYCSSFATARRSSGHFRFQIRDFLGQGLICVRSRLNYLECSVETVVRRANFHRQTTKVALECLCTIGDISLEHNAPIAQNLLHVGQLGFHLWEFRVKICEIGFKLSKFVVHACQIGFLCFVVELRRESRNTVVLVPDHGHDVKQNLL